MGVSLDTSCDFVVIFHIYLGSVSHFCSYTLLIITIMIQLLNTNKLPHPNLPLASSFQNHNLIVKLFSY